MAGLLLTTNTLIAPARLASARGQATSGTADTTSMLEPAWLLETRSWAGMPLTQLADVADDAHAASTLAQAVEHAHHLLEALVVERAEALVDEQRLEVEPAGLGADGVAETEGQGQRRHERLATGEGGGLAARTRPGVDDPQAQTAAGAAPGQRVGVDQRVTALRHHLQPLVGQPGHLLQPRRQQVGRQPHPQRVVGARAGHAVGELLHHRLLRLGRPDPLEDGVDLTGQVVQAVLRRLGDGLGPPGAGGLVTGSGSGPGQRLEVRCRLLLGGRDLRLGQQRLGLVPLGVDRPQLRDHPVELVGRQQRGPGGGDVSEPVLGQGSGQPVAGGVGRAGGRHQRAEGLAQPAQRPGGGAVGANGDPVRVDQRGRVRGPGAVGDLGGVRGAQPARAAAAAGAQGGVLAQPLREGLGGPGRLAARSLGPGEGGGDRLALGVDLAGQVVALDPQLLQALAQPGQRRRGGLSLPQRRAGRDELVVEARGVASLEQHQQLGALCLVGRPGRGHP